MKFVTVQRPELLEALVRAKEVVKGSASMPILNTVALSISRGQIKVDATNFETWGTWRVAAESVTQARLCVSPHAVAAFLSPMVDDVIEVAIDQKANKLHLTNKRGTVVVPGYDVAEFPVYMGEDAKWSRKVEIAAEVVHQIVGDLAYAAADAKLGTALASLNSLNSAFSTDGYRAARASQTLAHELSLPADAVKIVPKALGLDDIPTVDLRVSEQFVKLTTNAGELTMRRLEDADLSNTERTLDKLLAEAGEEITVGRAALVKQLTLLKAFGVLEFRGTVADETLLMEAISDGELLPSRDQIVLTPITVAGADMVFAAKVEHLLEAISHIDGDLISLSIAGPGRPMRIRAAGGGGPVHIIVQRHAPGVTADSSTPE